MNINAETIGFDTVADSVYAIAKTMETKLITKDNQSLVYKAEGFSEYGFNSFGKMVGFPANFVTDVSIYNPQLALNIVKDRVQHYFDTAHSPFYVRSTESCGERIINGVVSNKYSYFDDNQVIDILDGSVLADMRFQNAIITPERLHLRAIDEENPFTVDGDDSPLYFAYFIDNSMVGLSSFRVQFGIYRLACTNGMIVPLGEYTLCRQVHRGNKNIAEEFNENVKFLSERQNEIKGLIKSMSIEKSAIEDLQADFKADYLSKKLNLNRKETEKVIDLYENTYDGRTRWGMANAITEFARDLKDINRREYIERAAFRVA